jgi:SAM-dependent methyltransferase
LDVYFCKDCYTVQLLDIVSPSILFKNYYHYVTGANIPMVEHFREMAAGILDKFHFTDDSLVVDIGSNDGTLLSGFVQKGFSNVLGIEPATNIAEMANENGIRTLNDFFNERTANETAASFGNASIITATNVFGHVDDLENFVKGVRNLLSDEGVFIIEVPHVVEMIKKLEFDTIYHEHLSYFSLTSLDNLFKRHGMAVVDVEKTDVHGGSIRVFVQKSHKESERVKDFLKSEKEFGIDKIETYEKFSRDVEMLRENLIETLINLKKQGFRIVGYGASAKGNVLTNYCKIGPDVIEYISDTTPLKQGRYTPGMHIPVVNEERFHKDNADYAIILAWNYTDRILEKEKEFRKRGGKFIIPVPVPKVV